MRKSKIIIAVSVLFALAVTLLAGCSSTTVSSIAIAQGSFKEVYALDEVPDYSRAQLVVTYTDGKQANVRITEDMVSGLSTSKTVTGATLTVTYKGFKATFMYRVSGSVNVDTSVRLKTEIAETVDGRNAVKVKIYGIEQDGIGVYAVKFTLSGVGGVVLDEPTPIGGDVYKTKWTRISDNTVNVVVYSVTGYDSFTEGAEITCVWATLTLNQGSLNIQSITISDGTRDYVVPGSTIKFA